MHAMATKWRKIARGLAIQVTKPPTFTLELSTLTLNENPGTFNFFRIRKTDPKKV